MISRIKKNPFLTGISILYIGLLVLNFETGTTALGNTVYYLKEMLIIMPIVFLLTALIDAWVPKDTITKFLGENSGFKGSFMALALGSISAGPIYAAFPVAKTLLKKGASVGNIVVILSSWAVVKIPMLANEVKFLGFKFMAFRWVFTVISIFLMGYIVSKSVPKSSIPLEDDMLEKNRIKVDKETCIGCGICEKTAPEHFQIEDKKGKKIATPKVDFIEDKDKDQVIEAKEKCPVNSIKLGGLK